MAMLTVPEAHAQIIDIVRRFNAIAARFVVQVTDGAQWCTDEATIAAVATMIHSLDTLLAGLAHDGLEREDVYQMAHGARHAAFLLMTRLNPDQAWFWTEAWQAGEREVDADIAAGRLLGPFTEEEFDALLRAARPDVANL